MSTTVPNPYLTGNFAPVRDERDDAALTVTGAIPPALDGVLLRNGPNPVVDAQARRVPLVPRRRHAARHRAARRQARATATDGCARRQACAALGETAPDGPPEVNGIPRRGEHRTSSRTAGRIYALVESSLPTEVRTDLSTIGADRLRRRAHDAVHRTPEGRPDHRRAAFLRLRHVRPAVPALPRARPERGKLVTTTDIDDPAPR